MCFFEDPKRMLRRSRFAVAGGAISVTENNGEYSAAGDVIPTRIIRSLLWMFSITTYSGIDITATKIKLTACNADIAF
jgi:hypothetical protein